MLNENINKYNELQLKAEELKVQMEGLKATIMEEMDSQGLDKTTTPEGNTAQIVVKETFKYDDEVGMINFLKANGMTQFIVERINTTPMNKELKKGLTLTESLKPLYTRTVSRSFSVKTAN